MRLGFGLGEHVRRRLWIFLSSSDPFPSQFGASRPVKENLAALTGKPLARRMDAAEASSMVNGHCGLAGRVLSSRVLRTAARSSFVDVAAKNAIIQCVGPTKEQDAGILATHS